MAEGVDAGTVGIDPVHRVEDDPTLHNMTYFDPCLDTSTVNSRRHMSTLREGRAYAKLLRVGMMGKPEPWKLLLLCADDTSKPEIHNPFPNLCETLAIAERIDSSLKMDVNAL